MSDCRSDDSFRRGIPDFTRFGRGLRPVECQLPVLSAKNRLKTGIWLAVSMLKRKMIFDLLMNILGTIWSRSQLPVNRKTAVLSPKTGWNRKLTKTAESMPKQKAIVDFLMTLFDRPNLREVSAQLRETDRQSLKRASSKNF